MKKLLYITPHLSTGGLPRYLLEKIDNLFGDYYIYCIEYTDISGESFVTQKKQIKGILEDKLITLGKDKNDLIKQIKSICPDIIHFEEIPETFISSSILFDIYTNNRSYKIFETCHSSEYSVSVKKFFPDKFLLINSAQKDRFKNNHTSISIIEYPIIYKNKSDRSISLTNLGLDINKIHVLNVGIFNKNKNQGEILNYARILGNKYQFHFIGPQADNFKDYWEPLMANLPPNCKWWGEREDVDTFYNCMDMFLFTSKLEANPIVVKEAIGWKIPIIMYNLAEYRNSYNSYDCIYYLNESKTDNIDLIKNIDISKSNTNETKCRANNMLELLTSEYENTLISKRNYICLDYFNNRFKVETKSSSEICIKVDDVGQKYTYLHKLDSGKWFDLERTYYSDWSINLNINGKSGQFKLDLSNKIVDIINESSSLGDFIAWMPVVDEFQKKHNCILRFFTPNKYLFQSRYKNIQFYDYSYTPSEASYVCYKLGVFKPNDEKHCRNSYFKQNLQEIACDLLGMEFNDVKPTFASELLQQNSAIKNTKYVCIAPESTALCKFWLKKGGWQSVVDYLNDLGYGVLVAQEKKPEIEGENRLKDVIYLNQSLKEWLPFIQHCEFFIGLSSGLSWVAWALGKRVVLISGFTNPKTEFFTPYRVINNNVCNSCWNKHLFDKSYDWCPEHKGTDREYECSKNISFEMVKEKIDLCIKDVNSEEDKESLTIINNEIFEFDIYQKKYEVEEGDVVLDLGCSFGPFYFKNHDKNIKYYGLDASIYCIKEFEEKLPPKENVNLLNRFLSLEEGVTLEFKSIFHHNLYNKVTSITFPNLLKEIGPIDFMKFDIEGFEKIIFDDNYDLFKKNVKKFAGEFHFINDVMTREESFGLINKLKNDKEVDLHIYSVDGVCVTDYFFNQKDYYSEIIVNGIVNLV